MFRFKCRISKIKNLVCSEKADRVEFKALEDSLRPGKAFQSPSLMQRVVAALIPVSNSVSISGDRGTKVPVKAEKSGNGFFLLTLSTLTETNCL